MSVIDPHNKFYKDQLRQLIAAIQSDFSTVRNRQELSNVIINRFFSLFDFDDVIVSMADRSNFTHQKFVHCTIPGVERNEGFFRVTEPNYNFNDGFYDVSLAGEYSIVWDLDNFIKSATVPAYLVNLHRNQVKKILGISLKSTRGEFGCVFFLSRNRHAFIADEPGIAFETAGLLSAALNNLMFVESTERRERDRQSLFDLISLIGDVKGRADLERVAAGPLKNTFHFNDFIIPILNPGFLTHKVCLSYFEKEVNLSEAHLEEIRKGTCCTNDGLIDAILQSDYPLVWNVNDVLKWKSVPLYVQIWAEHNMRKLTGIPIRSKGQIIGAILFASTSQQAFLEDDLSKINVLKKQLAITVLNILANEEKANKEYEKDILLSLSNGIAAIRSKQELQIIIRVKLKSLLSFNDFIIIVPVFGKSDYKPFVYELEETRAAKKDFKFLDMITDAKDHFIDSTRHSEYPVTLNVEQLQSKDLTDSFGSIRKTGIKEIVGSALTNGGEHVGILLLTSEQSNTFSSAHLSLIKSISGQLSIVISNIIANEIITEREKDVSFLLMFSNEISTARNRVKLQLILDQKIKWFITFNSIAIVIYDDESKSYQNFLNVNRRDRHGFLFGDKTVVDHELADGLQQITKQADGPISISFDDLVQKKLIGANRLEDMEQLIGVCIRNGKRILGSLYVQQPADYTFSNKDKSLLQGITDQLSFAVFNILTNERDIKKESEQKVLLELSKDIAKVRSRIDLLKMINDRLAGILNFSHFSIFKLNEESANGYVFLNSSGPNSKNSELSTGLHGVFSLKNNWVKTAIASEKPIVFTIDEISEKLDEAFFALMPGIKNVIIVPFYDNKHGSNILMFLSKESDFISLSQLTLLQGFSVQLSIAMSNITANEKIEKLVLEIAGSKKQLEVENLYLQEEIYTTHNYSELIGMSAPMHEVFRLISNVSETQSSVLLLGETGTGKELIARAIHNNSTRKGKVMVKVNCATLPANLIESELFGHERGSFTGATDKRIGKFELANNSTIFLDEIGEMPLDLQVKLLRALQEKEIERVGGRAVIKTDVRVIAATNRDLVKEVQLGNFRSDLFFRLNVFPITIPSLRERIEDVPLLAAHFLEKHNKKANKKVIGFSTTAMKELMAYRWPGNVRELEHLIERTILMTTQPTIHNLHLPNSRADVKPGGTYSDVFKTIDEVERDHIMAVLKSCGGKVGGAGGAAEILKLPATTVHSKMKRLGIGKKFSTDS